MHSGGIVRPFTPEVGAGLSVYLLGPFLSPSFNRSGIAGRGSHTRYDRKRPPVMATRSSGHAEERCGGIC